MGATEGMSFLSLRTLNTVTVTLALGLVALVGWHAQNPAHFELIQVPTPPAPNPACCRLAAQELLWRRLPAFVHGRSWAAAEAVCNVLSLLPEFSTLPRGVPTYLCTSSLFLVVFANAVESRRGPRTADH